VADWIYDALESFQTFMDKGSLADAALTAGISAIGLLLAVAVHECGHALAALLTGSRLRELRVGDTDDVTVTAGTFRLRLGRLRGEGDVGGYVIHDARSSTPRHVLAIALAGPAANLLGAAVVAAFAVRAEGMLSVALFLWVLTSLAMGVTNLRPHGDPDNPAGWNDGRWVQVAWRARHAPLVASAAYSDPNTPTSVPPPAS
jgi:hypothetical protein